MVHLRPSATQQNDMKEENDNDDDATDYHDDRKRPRATRSIMAEASKVKMAEASNIKDGRSHKSQEWPKPQGSMMAEAPTVNSGRSPHGEVIGPRRNFRNKE